MWASEMWDVLGGDLILTGAAILLTLVVAGTAVGLILLWNMRI